jgi:hypothetical protein
MLSQADINSIEAKVIIIFILKNPLAERWRKYGI